MTDQPNMDDLTQARLVAGLRGMLEILSGEIDAGERARIIANIRADLTEPERLALASALLCTVTADTAFDHVQREFEGRGLPTAGIMADPRADAEFWATGANSAELMAYATRSYLRMSKSRRAQFLEWAGKQE